MTHTKNILKSLLITVMALSLLAVSCKKDENGGGTPTNPTSVTIDAATLNGAIGLAGSQVQVEGVTIEFSNFEAANGKANLNATITAAVTLDNLKTGLESALSFSSGGATATATATVPDANTGKDTATVKVEIDAGNNTFADDVKTSYTVTDKKAAVEITITPDKNWNNK